MIEYTHADLIPVMKRIVQDAGADFRYKPKEVMVDYGCGTATGCHYKWMGEADCGIGRLLHKLGVPLDDLGDGGTIDGESIDQYYDHLEMQYGMKFTLDAQAFMESFQENQDENVPWGICLGTAIDDAEDVLNAEN